MVEPDLIDENLNFGVMRIVPGKAFNLREAKAPPAKPAAGPGAGPQPAGEQEQPIPVAKRWTKLDGRDFLIEAVEYAPVKEPLKSLPARPADAKGTKKQASTQRQWPARKLAQSDSSDPIKLASGPYLAHGLVVDYSMVYGTNEGEDFTFYEGQTYYVSEPVNLAACRT